MIDASIIILNYNGKSYLKNCLTSIFENTHNITFEVILVDNASTDQSVEFVKGEFSAVRVIENKENVGFAKGNNIGVEQAKGEYIIILNNDTIVLPNAINNLISFMKKEPIKMIVTGKVLKFKRHFESNCGRFPTFLSEYLYFGFFLIRYIKNPYSQKFRIKTWERDKLQEIDWVSGCYFAIKKDEMLKLNGFDENFFLYYEDVDLCYRFRNSGGRVLYYPQSVIKHLKGGTSQTDFLKAISINYKSAIYYFTKICGKFNAKILNLLIKITWLLDIIALSVLDISTFLKYSKIKKKLKLLNYLLGVKI
ncbi:N-acetylglucosaminyl-diphospho-decaprenol L-rhamnosyltransferase [subsurface metagenome]